ncbi:MAG TPA: MotA/TolQ/ExbB proton channel family protein [Pirellulales bacterium]|nr:MotA/TolQ/ExbB proton channel family protein [Pirellulales bacterium]
MMHPRTFLLIALQVGAMAPFAASQDGSPPENVSTDEKLRAAEERFDEAMNAPDEQPAAKADNADALPAPLPAQPPNLLELWMMGGPLMVPITFMSFVVVVFAVERGLALRRRKVIPPAFVAALNELANAPGGFDPQRAYQLCQQHPSTTANVVRAVLLKVGRPTSELEHAMKETSEREAARLYKNVRPITLAVSITPLLGLLGTVQGMIECFYKTANLAASANKTQELANGIYVALVTTFGGLVVAIPAAVIAHYFEGRIQAHFYEIDELLLGLLPRLEAFEGKIRVTQ